MGAEQLVTDNIGLWTSAIRAKATQGRGSNKKRELYGIKKLRELILELAVRGKLVPQDPNDEPVSEFLERIADAKTQLIKDKKIKKTKILSEIKNKDVSFPLPAKWQWVKLGDLVEMYNGRAFKSSDWATTGLPIVRIQNLNNEKAEFNYFDGDLADHHRIDNGSFLISWSGTPGTSFGAFIWTRGKAALNQHINKCVFHTDEINLVFMRLAVNGCMNHFIEMAQGAVGLKHVTIGTLNNAIFGFPPLSEQERIVAKVDELMGLCDQLEQHTEAGIEAHQVLVETLLESLTNAKDDIDLSENWGRLSEHFDTLITTDFAVEQLKKAILQLAVMGKLVPQDPAQEPASELLKRIVAEKKQLINEGKIRTTSPLPEITVEEKPYSLPKGWEWCRIDTLTQYSEAGWSPKCHDFAREKNAWGVLKISAVTWGEFKPQENKRLPDNLEPRPELEVRGNDFLISRANTPELVARSVVVPFGTETKLMMSDKIIRFTFSEHVSPSYLSLANNSQCSRAYYARIAGGTSSSMKNVSRHQIQMLAIALPPLEEQIRIVDKVNQLLAMCDQLKARLCEVQTTQLNLTQAVVYGVIGEPVKGTEAPESNTNDMKITTTLSLNHEDFEDDAIIAPIILELGGSADAKDVWGKTRLSLPEFYAQLKVEIDALYIKKPASAEFKEA